jgi:hypothetical protein
MAMTLRNLPKKLDRLSQQRAKAKGISANKAVISLLEEQVGRGSEKPSTEYHDLDALTEAWSKTEADALNKRLARQRFIDPDLWA